MEVSNRRSCGVDTTIIVKQRLYHTQCWTTQPPMLKHSQGQVPGYIPQQTAVLCYKIFADSFSVISFKSQNYSNLPNRLVKEVSKSPLKFSNFIT